MRIWRPGAPRAPRACVFTVSVPTRVVRRAVRSPGVLRDLCRQRAHLGVVACAAPGVPRDR